jgi:hypothetical protein
MKLASLLVFSFVFVACTNNKTIKDNNLKQTSIDNDIKINDKCIENARLIAIDTLKTDKLELTNYTLHNGIKGIVFSNKYGLKIEPTIQGNDLVGIPKKDCKIIFIGINDSCGVDTILVYNDTTELIERPGT